MNNNIAANNTNLRTGYSPYNQPREQPPQEQSLSSKFFGLFDCECFKPKLSPHDKLKHDLGHLDSKTPAQLLKIAVEIGKHDLAPETWTTIVRAIAANTFSKDPLILEPLAKSLANVRFEDIRTQRILAIALSKRCFGYDQQVLQTLVNSLDQINFTDSDSQVYLRQAFDKGCFGKSIPNSTKSMLSKSIDKAELFILQEQLKDHVQFAANFMEYDYQDTDSYCPKISTMNVEYCFTAETQKATHGYGTHGITYDKNGNPELLIIYSEDLNQKKQNKPAITEKINGLIYAPAESKFLYQDALEHIKVFSLQPALDNLPRKLDLSRYTDKFTTFPSWLQSAIIKNQFKATEYKSAHLISFIMDFVTNSLIQVPELKNKCNNIIAKVISGQGNSFSLSSNVADDAKIKDAINMAFNADDATTMNKYVKNLQQFWHSLTKVEDKLQLIFILGQIAKKGALGYHQHNDNTANIAFYKLCQQCLEWFIRDEPSSEQVKLQLKEILEHLKLGLCIEVETNKLLTSCPQVDRVWQKNTH